MSKRISIADMVTGSSSGALLANSRECVRIMGVIVDSQRVDLHSANTKFPGFDPKSCGELRLLTLDDGTSMETLWTPKYMIDRLNLEPGLRIECIARLRQNSDTKRWYADTLMLLPDPNVESLHWMELSRPPSRDECTSMGYPRIKMNANEAFRLICVQSEFEKSGVSVEDLALVMHTPISKMKDYIIELQMNGMIYQNELGNFVPL